MTAEELWRAGKIRAAYDASVHDTASISTDPGGQHPFRDDLRSLEIARELHDHGVRAWYAARFAEARSALERAYAIRQRSNGDAHPETLDTLERLAAVSHYELAKDAAARFEAVLASAVELYGDDHVRTAIVRRNAAACMRDKGLRVRARELIDRAREVLDRQLSPEHPEVVAMLKVDAMIHLWHGASADAIRLGERAVAMGKRCWDLDHPFVATAELIVTGALLRVHDVPSVHEAAKRLPRIVDVLRSSYGDHPMLAIALHQQAKAAHARGQDELAEQLARDSFVLYRCTYPVKGLTFGRTLVEILLARGKLDDAVVFAHVLEPMEGSAGRAEFRRQMATALVAAGDERAALPWLERARDASESDDERGYWNEQVADVQGLLHDRAGAR